MREEKIGVDAIALGAVLRDRRRHLQLTQGETAALAEVSTRVLSDLENGRPTVRLDILDAVASALGLELTLSVRSTP